MLEDLAWLGFSTSQPIVRQSDDWRPYEAALAGLRERAMAYACDCSRSTFVRWTEAHGRAWSGGGCPGGCRSRELPDAAGLALRVELGEGEERVDDLLAGPIGGAPSAEGDLVVRDRHGNWTYPFAVVVDDLRQAVDLVVRGADLIDATARQVRLGRLLGRETPPRFAHHGLIRKASGAKLSKADRDTGIRDLRAAGWSAAAVIGAAAHAVRLLDGPREVAASEVSGLVRPALRPPAASVERDGVAQ